MCSGCICKQISTDALHLHPSPHYIQRIGYWKVKQNTTLLNKPYFYIWYWNGTSLQWRLMWRFEKVPRISLGCKLVPVQYRENQYGPLGSPISVQPSLQCKCKSMQCGTFICDWNHTKGPPIRVVLLRTCSFFNGWNSSSEFPKFWCLGYQEWFSLLEFNTY